MKAGLLGPAFVLLDWLCLLSAVLMVFLSRRGAGRCGFRRSLRPFGLPSHPIIFGAPAKTRGGGPVARQARLSNNCGLAPPKTTGWSACSTAKPTPPRPAPLGVAKRHIVGSLERMAKVEMLQDRSIFTARVPVLRIPARAGIGGRARRLRREREGADEQDRRVRRTDRLTARAGIRRTGTS